MLKRLTTFVIAFVMALTCFVPVTGVASAATETCTKSDGTYAGSFPTLPNAISEQAIKCSWPYGTTKAKYKYKGGSPTKDYKKALDIAYPDRSKWGKQTRAGASCDVFVGTVVRSCGYDKSFPRGLEQDLDYLPKNKDKWEKTKVTKVADMKPGDIIMYTFKNGGGHICIYTEVGGIGYIANAHYVDCGGAYGVRDAKAKDYVKSNFKTFAVYRPKNKCKTAFTKGSNSSAVAKLQNFLNWAGFDCGEADGVFGQNTEAAVIAFQTAAGLETDGKFGSQSLAAAKLYTPKNPKPIYFKKAYTGKYPAKVIKKGKGKKTDIKRWQKYLKWYGYSVKADGVFGKQTDSYTKKFQKKNGLEADGIVGKRTVKKAKSIKK